VRENNGLAHVGLQDALTAALFKKLETWKYLRWLNQLSPDVLIVVLDIAGRFGERYELTRDAAGALAVPDYVGAYVVGWRCNVGLRAMAEVRHGREPEHLWPDWLQEEPLSGPGWTDAFAATLASTPGLEWAAPLDAKTLAYLLWGIGEYEVRMREHVDSEGVQQGLPPRIAAASQAEAEMRALLLQLTRVTYGRLADIAAVQQNWPAALAKVS
jgi:hypothetical protein